MWKVELCVSTITPMFGLTYIVDLEPKTKLISLFGYYFYDKCSLFKINKRQMLFCEWYLYQTVNKNKWTDPPILF